MRLFGRSSKMTKLAAAIHRVEGSGKGCEVRVKGDWGTFKDVSMLQMKCLSDVLPHHLSNVRIPGERVQQ